VRAGNDLVLSAFLLFISSVFAIIHQILFFFSVFYVLRQRQFCVPEEAFPAYACEKNGRKRAAAVQK